MTVAQIIQATLAEQDLEWERLDASTFAVALPGEKRLKTACWLTVRAQGLAVEAFVVRKPDENVDEVHRWLLAHNAKMYGVAWSIDDAGDIYLTGRLPLAAVTTDEIDRLLGVVLDYADTSFNTLLELGFGDSIRREWAWRESRGDRRP